MSTALHRIMQYAESITTAAQAAYDKATPEAKDLADKFAQIGCLGITITKIQRDTALGILDAVVDPTAAEGGQPAYAKAMASVYTAYIDVIVPPAFTSANETNPEMN